MRVGSAIYATQQGLGILAKSFYDYGIVNDVFIIEHSRHSTQWQWYPETVQRCPIRELDRSRNALQRWVGTLDVLLCFETPFYWPIVDFAKKNGVKTVMMPMYECSLTNPPATFDEYWCPSVLDMRVFCGWPETIGGLNEPFIPSMSDLYKGSICRFTPVPVEVEWRQRMEARVFVHNAGHGGLKGRNGTKELIEALHLIKSPATFWIHTQFHDNNLAERIAQVSSVVDAHYSSGDRRYEDLYLEGDVFIFPEKFNGLSLPLQEARAAGMLVMAADRYPMNTWLPTNVEDDIFDGSMSFVPFVRNPLIPVSGAVKNRIGPPYMEFDEAAINPKDIAVKIDEWYGRDIASYSQSGKGWAESMSWEKLGPKYLELLEGLK